MADRIPRPLILAIDDDPGRYSHLRRLLGDRASLVVVSCPDCVAEHLPTADAVLLDHDLDAEPCACAEWACRDDTRAYLPEIIAQGVPVIVTSGSSAENRRYLTRQLLAGGATVTAYAATGVDGPEPETHWLGWLWARGVL